jgi:protein CWC15
MTSAHRSTFYSAKGKSEPGGHRTMQSNILSAKNMPSYLSLKRRNDGAEVIEDMKYNSVIPKIKSKEEYRLELLERENKANNTQPKLLSLLSSKDHQNTNINQPENNSKSELSNNQNDEEDEDDKEDEEDEEASQNSDDYDEEKELMKEYEKIKKEREEEKIKKEEDEAQNIKNITEYDIISGNPLYSNDYSLKKKWYEDTVFKNQAKREGKEEKKLNNDTLRTDYHKKFMNKTIQ